MKYSVFAGAVAKHEALCDTDFCKMRRMRLARIGRGLPACGGYAACKFIVSCRPAHRVGAG